MKKKARNGKRSKYWQEPACAGGAEEQRRDPASEAPSARPAVEDENKTPRAEESMIPEAEQQSVCPTPEDTSMPPERQKQTISTEAESHQSGHHGEKKSINAEAHEAALDADMVAYLQMVISLIEGRAVSRPEILQMLKRCMRQRRMGRKRRVTYLINYLAEHPP